MLYLMLIDLLRNPHLHESDISMLEGDCNFALSLRLSLSLDIIQKVLKGGGKPQSLPQTLDLQVRHPLYFTKKFLYNSSVYIVYLF
jgi:hypothetical protein